jgi:hypothetical protein
LQIIGATASATKMNVKPTRPGSLATLSRPAEADSESVEELVEEGNAFEASIVDGVENAKDPDVSEVTTRQVPEDDVPEEYRNDNDHVA